ncbi:sulfotransferase domain-containing protein [Saccharothrix sp. AJ9571]|nr:sulfotransferase domain-containing protein [Saccharothrix sp. AJ9571]
MRPERDSGAASRVIVVALMKSGTHLIQELMIALGYQLYGQSRIPDEFRPALSAGERRRIARLVYGDDRHDNAADDAWEALGWAWQSRLGMPLVSRYGSQLVNKELIVQALRCTASTSFSETPENTCWILPELDVTRVDGAFLKEWHETGCPKIVFMYRDPRDATLSMVNFLLGKTSKGYGKFSDFTMFHEILASKKTLAEQVSYALSDPSFPGINDHERMLWLLHHPRVCTVSFEDLIGPSGSGSASAQEASVARILEFLGRDDDPEKLCTSLYRRDSFTFYKGQIGSWREEYTPENRATAAARFADVLTSYGYDR